MGSRIIKMDPAQGFAAQTGGAAVILDRLAPRLPAVDDALITGAVMGAGAAKRLSAVRWGLAGNIVVAWVLTLPAAAWSARSSTGSAGSSAPARSGRCVVTAGDARRRSSPCSCAAWPGAARAGRGMIAAVDTGALLELIWVAPRSSRWRSRCASRSIIVGVTKAGDCRRGDRPRLASAYAFMSIVTTALFLGGVVFAVTVIAAK